MNRFAKLQQNKTLVHAKLPQAEPDNNNNEDSSFTFVVAADAQFGMAKNNVDWQDEIQASRAAVKQINVLKPLFCCMCECLVCCCCRRRQVPSVLESDNGSRILLVLSLACVLLLPFLSFL